MGLDWTFAVERRFGGTAALNGAGWRPLDGSATGKSHGFVEAASLLTGDAATAVR